MTQPTDNVEAGMGLAIELEVAAHHLTPDPRTLLRLAEIFERYGNTKTASLLRNCADRVISTPQEIKVGFPAKIHSTWKRSDGQVGAVLSMPPLALDAIRQGMLLQMHAAPAGDAG